MSDSRKLAVIVHRVSPYHFARFRALGRLIPTVVIEMSGADHTYAWDAVCGTDAFARLTLFTAEDSRSQSAAAVSARLKGALGQCRPSALAIPGWSFPEALESLVLAAKLKIPAILFSDSTAWDEKRVAWKEAIKARILRRYSSALAAGAPHVEYLQALGMDRSRTAQGYDVVDNDYFAVESDKARARGPELRLQHQLPGRYFLASARFVDKKNLPFLIQAYARYRQLALASASEPWSLVLLGDGPLKPELDRAIPDLKLEKSVLMPGFKQYPVLPTFYGLAGAFVHVSATEQWGLVVNEAMASGLPVLVSNRCGCARDLIRDGVNGYSFDPLDSHKLAGLMLQASQNPTLPAMGPASREIISNWGPERFAQELNNAVNIALSVPVPPCGLIDRLLLKLLARRRMGTET